MSNAQLISDDVGLRSGIRSENIETPWYEIWKHVFIDMFEPNEHDFIGSNCGCFFVINQTELPHYKIIFERLCAMVKFDSSVSFCLISYSFFLFFQVKQNTSIRFIQSDFVRYFIVLSDQIFVPQSSETDDFTSICKNLKSDFPNSFVFYLNSDKSHITNQKINSNPNVSVLDQNHITSPASEPILAEISNAKESTESSSISSSSMNHLMSSDPLGATKVGESSSFASSASEMNENSKFYQEMQSQRLMQNQSNSQINTTVSKSIQSCDIINDWLSHIFINNHLKEIDSFFDSVDLMLR